MAFPAPICHLVPEVNTIYFRFGVFVTTKTPGFNGFLVSSCHVTNQPKRVRLTRTVYDYLSWVWGLTEFNWEVLS